MEEIESKKQEPIGALLIESINQLNKIALGAGAVTCQVCGETIPEGGSLSVFAFRPADERRYRVGHVKCADDKSQPTECFMLGVRELIVDGRVGRGVDQATQSDWPVLLAPWVRAVSPLYATEAFDARGLPPSVRMSRFALESASTSTDASSTSNAHRRGARSCSSVIWKEQGAEVRSGWRARDAADVLTAPIKRELPVTRADTHTAREADLPGNAPARDTQSQFTGVTNV